MSDWRHRASRLVVWGALAFSFIINILQRTKREIESYFGISLPSLESGGQSGG
jgi:hypothetical protein